MIYVLGTDLFCVENSKERQDLPGCNIASTRRDKPRLL